MKVIGLIETNNTQTEKLFLKWMRKQDGFVRMLNDNGNGVECHLSSLYNVILFL